MFKTNSLPSLNKKIRSLEHQAELAFICQYLLDEKYATNAGVYYKNRPQKPLFRDNNKRDMEGTEDEIEVTSMDRKSGAKLLKKPLQKLDSPLLLDNTMRWIVQEFPIVTEKAQRQYKQELNLEADYIHIIVAAAHTLSGTKNPKNTWELLSAPEKFIAFVTLGLVVMGMTAFYKHFGYEVQLVLIAFNTISVLLYFSSYILEHYKASIKKVAKEYDVFALALFLSIYMAIIASWLPPHDRNEYPNAMFYVMIFTIFLQVMCFYFALTRFIAIGKHYYRNQCTVVLYQQLIRYKKYIANLKPAWLLFMSGSIIAALGSNLYSLVKINYFL